MTTTATNATTSMDAAQPTTPGTCPAPGIAELAARGAHLIQLNPAGAADLYNSWGADEPCYYPPVDRNADNIRPDDIILFWVAGPGEKAGIVGFGLATGLVEDREHPRAYPDPDSPAVLRPSAEVALGWVAPAPVITRSRLRQHPEFETFDLFIMANRPNTFPVTPAQTLVVVGLLEEVLG